MSRSDKADLSQVLDLQDLHVAEGLIAMEWTRRTGMVYASTGGAKLRPSTEPVKAPFSFILLRSTAFNGPSDRSARESVI